MSTIILQVDEYEELVRACEKAEARVEELEDLLASVTPEKDAEGIILNAKRRLGGEPGDSLIQLCIKAKYDCDRYFAALEWQPIETAPKDGTRIDFKNVANGLQDTGCWCDYTMRGCFIPGDLEGEWNTDLGNGDMTHWRPIIPF